MKSQGFTLIEILVTVVIIGFLATFITLSVLGAQVKARDSRREADSNTVSKAFAAYYSDKGVHPPENEVCDSSIGSAKVSCVNMIKAGSESGAWATGLLTHIQSYLESLPVDPINKVTDRQQGRGLYYGYEVNNGLSSGAYPDGQCYCWVYYSERIGKVKKTFGDVTFSGRDDGVCYNFITGVDNNGNYIFDGDACGVP